MNVPCWLVGHRRVPGTRFVRRADGYPLAAYGACRRCDKRLGLTRGRGAHAPFNAELAAELARDD